jgi:hypothetical protein
MQPRPFSTLAVFFVKDLLNFSKYSSILLFKMLAADYGLESGITKQV